MGIKKVFYRSPHNYDLDEASNEAVIPADQQGESLTVQSMAEDADINVLMKRFGITGKMPESPRLPMFGDFTGVKDFASAMEAVLQAQDSFMELPAEVRSKFQNDPQKFLDFCNDEKNAGEMADLGLLKPEVVKARVDAKAAEAAKRVKDEADLKLFRDRQAAAASAAAAGGAPLAT